MPSTTVTAVHRRAAIIHPIVALTLATILATLATVHVEWPWQWHWPTWTVPADATTVVTTTEPWFFVAAPAVFMVAVALIVGMARRSGR